MSLCRFATITFLSVILIGCTPPKRVHVDYDQRASNIRIIGILAPDISFYDLTFGGGREKIDKWSEQANQDVVSAVKAELSGRGFDVKIIAREGKFRQSLDEISGLFTVIVWSYRRHVLVDRRIDRFPHKAASFDYSVGPIGEILDANHVDALVLVDGGGEGNSKLLQASTVILIALVDRTGALLWYEPYARRETGFIRTDMRDAAHVRKIVKDMFETLPPVRK